MDQENLEGVALMTKALSVLGGAMQPNLLTGASVGDLYSALAAVGKLDDVPGLAKASTYVQGSSATSGLTAYDLEAPAKLFYPVLSPLRNMLPRVSGKGGIQAAWRAITGVNVTSISAGVSEGNRGGVIQNSTQDYIAAYRGIGYESSATFEAQYAAQNFDDVRKRAAQTGLHSLMIAEERIIIGGNGTLALGITPTPSVTASTAGGTLAAQTWSVICVALTQEGYALNGGNPATPLTQSYVRSNADGTSDTINGGVAQKSTNATVGTTGATSSITATVVAVRGAQAYAWFYGAAGSETLGQVTTAPRVVITAAAVGTQSAASLSSTDNSMNGLVFDGLITQAMKPNSGAYWNDLGGLTLTPDGAGGIVEIDALLKNRWDTARLNPEIMWVSSQQSGDITRKIVNNPGGASNLRFTADIRQGAVGGGLVATTYLNKYGLGGATELQIKQHPYLTPGTILFTQSTVPYPLADGQNVMQVRTRQDYYQIEWPWRSRKYEYGVYADEVLQVLFPPALSVLTGIGNG